MAKRRQSPAKIEGAAAEAAEKAAAEAKAAGKSEEEIAAAAKAAAEAVRSGDAEKDDEKGGGEESGDELEDGDVEKLIEAVMPADVLEKLAKDQRKPPSAISVEERRLLAEACYVFGINPDPTLKPREVLSYRFDAGDPNGATPIPPYVSIVTGGGVKIRYPIDDDTEIRLRQVYNCFTVDKKSGERLVLPLPPDLTLPREAADGVVRSSEHQYRTGYLREGGKTAADKRQQRLDALRRQGQIR